MTGEGLSHNGRRLSRLVGPAVSPCPVGETCEVFFITGNPGFVNFATADFRLREDSPAYRLGFETIPVEQIGLYRDAYRKALPEPLAAE